MKLNDALFNKTLYNQLGYKNPNVITGPSFGVDTSIISLSENLDMVCASDPLSYLPQLGVDLSAYLSIHLIANDIVTSGVAPQYFQMVLNLPEYMDKETFSAYWEAIHLECEKHSIAITGGHTGWVFGQNSTVSGGGTMFSIAPKNTLLTSNMAQPKDVIIMTKTAAIASTAILGLQFPETAKKIVPTANHGDWKTLFYDISVLKEGKLISQYHKQNPFAVHAMHDITEGGVINAVAEMCRASGVQANLDLSLVPVKQTQRLLCKQFELSPFEIVGAGSLILSVASQFAKDLIQMLQDHGIDATAIGEFHHGVESTYLDENGNKNMLKPIEIDPYWHAFENALQNNWK